MTKMNPVELFEYEFRNFLGVNRAVAVCNGTAALHTALLAVGVQEGDEVITTPFTFPATVNMILACGAKPLFADINPETYCIDPMKVDELSMSRRVSAVLAVHLFGNVCDMDELIGICEEGHLALIEDTSQALGAMYNGKYAGTFGDAGTFSFYATKSLWTFEGGMVVTNNDDVGYEARLIRNHGVDDWGKMIRFGYNYKMPWNCAFQGWQMVLLHKPSIFAELGRYGPMDHRDIYSRLVYDHPYYQKLGIRGDCPVAEEVARKIKEGEI